MTHLPRQRLAIGMRVKAAVPAPACGILFLIAACGDGIRTWAVYQPHPGVPEIFRSAAGGRDLRTVIYGNPTTASKEAFHETVIAAMQGRNWGPTTRFTTRPSESARAGYRVVRVFSGDRSLGAEAACQELDPAALSPVAERVELQAVFYFNKRVLLQAHVTSPAFTTTGDRRLNAAVTEAVLSLFPVRGPERRPQGKRMFEP